MRIELRRVEFMPKQLEPGVLYASEEFGYEATADQFGFTSVIYLAEDEKTAWAELQPHLDYFRERCFALPMPMFFPPGYTTGASYRTRIEIARANAAAGGPSLFSGTPLVGTPEQVGEWLEASMAEAGAGIFMANFQIGDMPHGKVMRSMELFADRVLPYLNRPKQTTEPAKAVAT